MYARLNRSLIWIALAAGCGGVEYRGTASTAPGVLAEIDVPGVQVVTDYDEPVFYVDGSYWWSLGGVWYRSASYTGGWVRAPLPPAILRQIENPHRYRHYQPNR